MERKHRKLLLTKRLQFIKDLDANDITGYLFQESIITENDKETIENQATRREQVEHLMDLLPRKGPSAFHKFCEVLLKTDAYKHLGELLLNGSPAKGPDCVDAAPKKKRYSDLIVRPRSASKREPDMLNSYEMNSIPRGWCFIINNMNFLTLNDRLGSDIDAQNLQALYTSFGFMVWSLKDVDASEIRQKVTELANKTDHGDALVVCLLSHGLAGQIYGVGGDLISVSEILDIISAGPAGTLLKGKPKLFLIQACRTDEQKVKPKRPVRRIHSSEVVSHPNMEKGRQSPKPSVTTVHSTFIEQNNTHLQSDMLLGFSTFPGEVSWRNVSHGSYYIDSLVEVFREYATSEDVFSMLVKVNEKVLENVSQRGHEQIPAPVVTLTKKLYLLPP